MDLIHAAAEWGLQPMVARLAQEEPALVNAANEFGWTCLMLACSRGHVGLAAWLLDHGARLEQGDADGLTALTHAACGRRGRREAVALLLARGADPNAAGRWGSTALMEAAGLGLVERVRALLEGSPREGPRALRLDARDAKGSTALSRVSCWDGWEGLGLYSGVGKRDSGVGKRDSGSGWVPPVVAFCFGRLLATLTHPRGIDQRTNSTTQPPTHTLGLHGRPGGGREGAAGGGGGPDRAEPRRALPYAGHAGRAAPREGPRHHGAPRGMYVRPAVGDC